MCHAGGSWSMFMGHTPVRKWKAGLGRERSWHTHGCHQGLSKPFRELGSWDYFQSIPNRGLCTPRTATQFSLALPWEKHNPGRGGSQRLRAILGEGCTSELFADDNPSSWEPCVPWLQEVLGRAPTMPTPHYLFTMAPITSYHA